MNPSILTGVRFSALRSSRQNRTAVDLRRERVGYRSVSRRIILYLILTVAGLVSLSRHPAADEDVKLRMTTGLRATSHSIAWIGTQAGLFRKYGLDVEFPKLAVGGPETAAGLMRGDWEFVQTGVVPIAENVLKGGDAVIILRNTVPNQVGVFLVARNPFTKLSLLEGKRIGVPADIYSGQTSILGRLTLERAGVSAEYVVLGTYDRIFDALVAGDIDAGTLPIDFRFIGETKYGWTSFDTVAFGAPSIFATTRKMIATRRDVVDRVVRAMIESIYMFKTRPDIAVPFLQRFLGADDRQAIERLREYYAPYFPEVPRPGLSAGMADVRRVLMDKYPTAHSLEEANITDSSIIDEIEQSGFIRQIYSR
jgi:ABC-type nitrate/sulfonate/bicarbonate transport system substrate-binding protein